MKIGIDPGKYGVKAVTQENGKWIKFYMRSKYTKNPDNTMLGNNYLLHYDGDEYLFGEGGNDYSLDVDKQSIQHKLGTYLSINALAFTEPVEIVIGCPFNLFKNPIKREAYQNYIKQNNLIDLSVSSIETQLTINEVIPFAECAGIAYAQPDEDFKDTVRGVIDIGGLNINGCLFDNLNPVKDTDFTENLGSIILKDKLKAELNKNFTNINLQDYEINSILKNGLIIDGKIETRANEIIDEVLSDHFKKIINVMKKRNWSLNTLQLTIGGGGSLDIGIDIIQRFIPQAKMCKDPVWDNAKGNYIVAEMLF